MALPAQLRGTQTPASSNRRAASSARSALAPAARPLCQRCHRSPVLPPTQEQRPVPRQGLRGGGWYLQDAGGALPPQRAQDETPAAGAGGGADGVLPSMVHAFVAIVLLGEDLAVGIIPAKQNQAHTTPSPYPSPPLYDSPPSLALIASHSISPPTGEGSSGHGEGTRTRTRRTSRHSPPISSTAWAACSASPLSQLINYEEIFDLLLCLTRRILIKSRSGFSSFPSAINLTRASR